MILFCAFSFFVCFQDESGFVNDAEVVIEFAVEDLLPPVFDHIYYSTSIDDTNVQ